MNLKYHLNLMFHYFLMYLMNLSYR